MAFIGWIIVGLIAGGVASAIMGRRDLGCLGNIVLGLLGAVVGGLLMNWLNTGRFALPDVGQVMDLGFCSSILVATIGAVVVLFVARLLSGSGRRMG